MSLLNLIILKYTPGKSIKVHLYWAMKNCGGSPDQLRRLIENVPHHYMVCTFFQPNTSHPMCVQGNHTACPPTSSCHTSSYSPSKVQLTKPLVAQTLLSTLKVTNVYRMVPEFGRVSSITLEDSYVQLCINNSAATLTGWRASITNCSPTSRSGFTSPRPPSR